MPRLTIILTTLLLVGCTKTLVPMERTAIFPKELAPNLLRLSYDPPEGISSFWTPSEKDLDGVEDHLEEYLSKIWLEKESRDIKMTNWEYYYRQVGGIVINGKKMLFISYAWSTLISDPQLVSDRKFWAKKQGRVYDPNWWKTDNIGAHDGGSLFFRVVYDPSKKQFVWYDQNGRA